LSTDGRWQPYPAYKHSGVEWLGKIPAHWETRRLKYAAAVNTDTLPESTAPDFDLRYVDIGNVDSVGNILDIQEMSFEKAPSRARRRVRHGDTIISTVRTYLKAIAHIDELPDNLIVSTGFAVLRPRPGLDSKYLWRLVQSQGFVDAVVAHSEGIGYPAIAPTKLVDLPVWIPSLAEQRAIAAFLDREAAKIDALVANQERLIELLQERRAALISHAVTKGLDPTVPMRDSGIPWLGEIPGHWAVVMLKRLASIRYGLGQPPTESETGIPLIRATNVKHGRIAESGMMYVDPTDVPKSRDAELRAGEIIVVRSGAYTGDSAIVPEEYAGAIAGYDMVVTIRNGFSPYIAWQLLGPEIYELQFSFYKLRAAQPHLNAEELGSTLVAFPPEPEQRVIAAYLDRQTAKLDTLIAKAQEMIERSQEYRTALITAAVTGKIDVRES
jgi:type I restriction enzyme S subunit